MSNNISRNVHTSDLSLGLDKLQHPGVEITINIKILDDSRTGGPSQCLHDTCPECHGTGITRTGRPCVHMIACPCPKCSPRCGLL